MGHEVVELIHEVLGDKVRPANLVKRVAKYGHENLLK
jgi:hypothetical protein